MPEQAPLQKLVEQHTLDLIGVGVGETQSWVEREERAVKGRAGEGNEDIQSTLYDILKKLNFFFFLKNGTFSSRWKLRMKRTILSAPRKCSAWTGIPLMCAGVHQ